MPQAPDVWFRPLLLNTVSGGWCNLLRVRRAGVLSRHRHPMVVTGYVIRGRWHYLEHDWVAETGSFVYEPPGEIHTLVVPDDCAGDDHVLQHQRRDDLRRRATARRSATRTCGPRSRCAGATTRRSGSARATPIGTCASEVIVRLKPDLRRAYCGSGFSPTPIIARMFAGFAAVGIGAALGAWLRWGLSTWLNPRVPSFPLGTLAANLVGGYLVGFAVAFFLARHSLPPEVRLFVVTGFLGGLTTFSTFSAEVVELLMRGDWAAARCSRSRTWPARCC